jgi:hypothetical protein
MGIRNFEVISIAPALGSITTIANAAAKIAIPPMLNTDLPKFLRCLVAGGNAANLIYIMPTDDAVGSATTGLMLSPANPIELILNVHGYSHIGTAATGAEDTELYLYPLEDF